MFSYPCRDRNENQVVRAFVRPVYFNVSRNETKYEISCSDKSKVLFRAVVNDLQNVRNPENIAHMHGPLSA